MTNEAKLDSGDHHGAHRPNTWRDRLAAALVSPGSRDWSNTLIEMADALDRFVDAGWTAERVLNKKVDDVDRHHADLVAALEKRVRELESHVKSLDEQLVQFRQRVGGEITSVKDCRLRHSGRIGDLARRLDERTAHLHCAHRDLSRRLDNLERQRTPVVAEAVGLESALSETEAKPGKITATWTDYGRGPGLPVVIPKWKSCVVYRTANSVGVSSGPDAVKGYGATSWDETYTFDDVETAGRFVARVLYPDPTP